MFDSVSSLFSRSAIRRASVAWSPLSGTPWTKRNRMPSIRIFDPDGTCDSIHCFATTRVSGLASITSSRIVTKSATAPAHATPAV